MNTLLDVATKQSLLTAADAHAAHFLDPGSRQYDSQVAMFVKLFERYGGFQGYTKAIQYSIIDDRLQWPSVSGDREFSGDDNYSETLSEYVIAYLELGFGVGQDLTSTFRDAGVGIKDKKISPYTLNSANVKSLADAHCSIRAAENAGIKVKKELKSLQMGDFVHATAKGGAGKSCPVECSFSDSVCHAKF